MKIYVCLFIYKLSSLTPNRYWSKSHLSKHDSQQKLNSINDRDPEPDTCLERSLS